MKRRHVVAMVGLGAWSTFSVWFGAEHFDVGECIAVALIVVGLWVAFSMLTAVSDRRGRSTLAGAAACGMVGLLALPLIAPATHGTITIRPGEPYDAFLNRAVREIADAV